MDSNELFNEYSKLDDSFIYRFRPYSTIAIKELMYGEMYFSYNDELNDPFDHKKNLIIEKDGECVIKYLIFSALKGVKDIDLREIDLEALLGILCKDIIYKKINILDIKNDRYIKMFEENYNKTKLPKDDRAEFLDNLKNVIDNMIPYGIKTVSFSKQYNNPLMWSLYAGRHRGYCLIFKPFRNAIYLKRRTDKKYQKYLIQKVHYSEEVDVNLSDMFNEEGKIDSARIDKYYFRSLIEKCILTKHPSWKNEEEYRIFGEFSISFSSDKRKNISESGYDRTYFYKKNQLIGIILGAALSDKEKEEIIKVMDSKQIKYRQFLAKNDGNGLNIELEKIKL